MRKLLTAALLIALTTASCKHSKPEGIMDPNTMAHFLYEVHLIDSYYQVQTNYHYEEQAPEIKATYDKLFSKYGISKADYERSMNYYAHHNDQFHNIYAQVNDSLTALQQRTQALSGTSTTLEDEERHSIF